MKQFFKYLLASTVGTVVGFFLIIFLAGILIAGAIGSAMMFAGDKDKKVEIKENSIVKLDLSQPILERSRKSPFADFQFGDFEDKSGMALPDLLDALEAAKNNDKIKGMYLEAPYFAGGLSMMDEVREAILDFKSSGKFVVAYSEVYTQGGYYIATAADEVYLFQEGMMDFRGLGSQQMFFKNMLNNIGVEMTVVKGRDNKYKSAVEPLVREDLSEPNKEQLSALLGNIWNHMCGNISEARGVSADELNRIANELAIRKPEDAVSLGLMDGLMYKDQIQDLLKTKLEIEEDDEIEVVSMKDMVRAGKGEMNEEEKPWEIEDEVAVIYAIGGIGSGEGDEESIGSETLAKAIREAREDEDVKAIVMRVNSPGGSAMASEVIWRETILAGESKPFIVSFGDVAASGGYYISAHADRIFASPNTITGSIGAFGVIPNAKEMFNEHLGITFDAVTTNAHSDWGGIARPLDDMELSVVQGYLDQVYDEFVSKVADGRGTTFEMIDSIGRGRVWTGSDAINIGLVDEFGSLEDAIAYAAQEAGIEKYDVKELPKQKDPFVKFMEEMSGDMSVTIGEWVLGEDFEIFERVNEMRKMEGIQMRMLYDIKVR